MENSMCQSFLYEYITELSLVLWGCGEPKNFSYIFILVAFAVPPVPH